MDKKKVIIVAFGAIVAICFVIFTILTVGLYMSFFNRSDRPDNECDSILNVTLRDACYFRLTHNGILSRLDRSYCERIQNLDLKEQCLIQFFAWSDEPECDKLNTSAYRDECLYIAYHPVTNYNAGCSRILNESLREKCFN